MNNKKIFSILSAFRIPLVVAGLIILYAIFSFLHLPYLALPIVIAAIALGSFGLFKEVFEDILANQFALDYIAILAIAVSLITKEFFVGSIIALMLSTGRTLEEYGANQAKRSLSLLIDRIPSNVLVEERGNQKKLAATDVKIGQTVIIRKGEVVALDGILLSKEGSFDESSLTGEPYPVDKYEDDIIRSGTVNAGDVVKIAVTSEEKDSTYKKIISMVENAQKEKPPLLRLADKYSIIFTIITFIVASFAFFYSHSLEGVLAVLVVATPCPLILATPIALLGGVNAAARKRIIVKNLASIETLARVNALVFDKTGTITLGKPVVVSFLLHNKTYAPATLLAIAYSLERNSLHPLAKAICSFAIENKVPFVHAESVTESIGKGVKGTIDKKSYTLSKLQSDSTDILIGLFEQEKHIATFTFADRIKEESKDTFAVLENLGLALHIFTGDRQEVAEKLVQNLGIHAQVLGHLSPQQKQDGILRLRKQKKTVAMVGDGINDAPALALADVGLVFSNEEQTAASEAADIVFLGGDFSQVLQSLAGAKKTIGIAMQSIIWGIGLSILAMVLASFGLIPPIFGAILQEGIDITVILNALRASKG